MFISPLRMKLPALRLLAGLLLAAALSACEAPTLPPPGITPPAGPTVVVPTPAITFPPSTPMPTVPPFAAKDVRIDIDAGDYQVKGMLPNRSVQLPWEGSPYGLIIHYPFAVGGYTINPRIGDPKSVTWDLEAVQPPDANSLAFILSGPNIGFFNVEIQVGSSQAIRFQVQVMGPGTPMPPPPTPAPISLMGSSSAQISTWVVTRS